ncbi:MAG: enoyl-CoA hydratase [Anaerolineae bacterium]
MGITTAQQDGILHIQFDRPEKKNAITHAMYTVINEALAAAEEDDAIRVILFTGNEAGFTAGNDLFDFMQSPPQDENSPVFIFLLSISQATKPLVAAVNGSAVGVGTTMLLHCDLVYAAENARFQLPFVNLGLVPEAASSLLLPRIMGHARAADLLMLGEPFDAQRAHELGLLTAVCPPEGLDATAWQAARNLASKPPEALRLTKRLMKQHEAARVQEAIHAEATVFLDRLSSAELAEAVQAFFNRRA